MKKLIALALISLAALGALSAQEWQYDEENEIYYNCSLVARMKADFGEENIMKFPDGDLMTWHYFADRVFSTCADFNRGGDAGQFDDTAAEPTSELQIVAVLDDHEFYSLDEADCSVSVKDRFEEDLNVSLAGAQQDSMSVDVYLPGASEPLDMPHVNNYEIEAYGVEVPVRTEWALGSNFPLGRYTFDVHIADASYRLQWLRREAAVNTIVVTCVDDSPLDADENAVLAELQDGEIYQFLDSDCVLETSDFAGDDDDLKLLVSGEEIDSMELRIFYPGAAIAVAADNVIGMETDEGMPYRVELIYGETFPTGIFAIEAIMDEQSYRFSWDRQDDRFRSVMFSCTR